MTIYFAILAILAVGALGDIFMVNKKNRRDLYIFSVGILILFFGTRGYIGCDWYSYMPIFENSRSVGEIFTQGFLPNGFEKGYQFFSGVVRTFTDNYIIFSFVNTLIDFALIYYIFKKYSKYPILALFIYFGVYGVALEIDMLRNVKSILLFLCSLEYIERGKSVKFLLLNILGALFHTSSLLYLPSYFLLRVRWNKFFILGLFLIGNIYYLLDLRLLVNSVDILEKFLPSGIGGRIGGYLSIVPKDFPLGFSLYYLERVAIFIVVFILGDRLFEKRYGKILVNSLYLTVFIFLYTSELSVLSLRIGILFVYSYWLVIPLIIECIDNRVFQVVIFLLALGISIFRLNNQLNFIGNREIYSYETILLKHKSAKEKRAMVEEVAKYKELAHGKEISVLF